MRNAIKWILIVVIAITVVISGKVIKGRKASNELAQSIFKFDPEHGFVVPIPQSNARFMGLPMFMAITPASGNPGRLCNEDLERASRALTVLSQCIEIAESRLVEYSKPDAVTAADIRNPHVWIDGEDEDKTRWAFVVEAKDNDGYAWHIEFKGAQFHDIWAGS
ncbi:MAG: hypothetical protein V4662_10110 [Verrucomicrobiota bacterium]